MLCAPPSTSPETLSKEQQQGKLDRACLPWAGPDAGGGRGEPLVPPFIGYRAEGRPTAKGFNDAGCAAEAQRVAGRRKRRQMPSWSRFCRDGRFREEGLGVAPPEERDVRAQHG